MKKREYSAGFLICQTKVLLIRKAKPNWQKGKLNAIGGSIEEGELPIDAMVREFLEETGILTKKEDWTHYLTTFGPDWTVYYFKAFNDKAMEFPLISIEGEPVNWYDNENLTLRKDIVPDLVWNFPMIFEDAYYRHFSKILEKDLE